MNDFNQSNTASCCTPVVKKTEFTSPSASANLCPTCGVKGKKIDTMTVKAMLSVSLLQIQDTQYYFCREADCDAVYFSADSEQVFGKADVRERVYQKELQSDDVQVCYCFDHTPQSIRLELVETGTSTVLDEINVGTKAGQCACEIRNPQGSCCLGNVRSLLTAITEQIDTVTA